MMLLFWFFVVVWVLAGVYVAGTINAFFQRNYPHLKSASDWFLVVVSGVMGLPMLACLLLSRSAEGYKWTRFGWSLALDARRSEDWERRRCR